MLTIEELDEFDKSIKKINPDCNYRFLLLNTTGDLITYKNLIHKMVEVNTMEEPKENKKNSEDIALWKNIFEELGITLNI